MTGPGWLRRAVRGAAVAVAFAAGASLVQIPTGAVSAVALRIWTEPSNPLLGEPATIFVATYWYESGSPATSPRPMVLPEFPWDFVADSPAGTRHLVALNRDTSADNQWTGEFMFDEFGKWEVGLDPRNLGTPLDPAAGARRQVLVRNEPLASFDPAAAFIGAAVAGGSALAVLLAVRARRGRT